MFTETFWMIFAICFWVLLALAIVIGYINVYIRCMYYKWDKEDREREELSNKVGEILDEKLNLGGGDLESQN